MDAEKQNVSITFGKGLDTKNDPNQVVPGKLLVLENVVMQTPLEFQKRNGYQKLATLSAGVNIGTFESELVAFNGSSLSSYSPSTQTMVNKGNIISVDVSTSSVFRSATGQNTGDSAYHTSGLYLYTWIDTTNGAQYMVVSSATGTRVVAATSLVTSAVLPKAWCIGNYLIVTYIDSSNGHLKYISIPISTLTPSSPVDLSTQASTANAFYDGVVLNNALYLAFNGSDGGGAVRITYLDAGLTQHSVVAKAGEAASNCIGVFSDTGVGNPNVWVTYFDGSNIRYFIVNSSLGAVLAPTNIIAASGINNITGYASGGSGTIYYQTQNTYSYSSVRTDFLSSITATSSGAIGASSVFLRGVGLISKPFIYNGTQYFVVAYSGSLQPTYFVVNSTGTILAKLAYSNGGGYTTQATLCQVNSISGTQFQFTYLFKDLLTTQQGQVYSQTGVNSGILDFGASDLYQLSELGANLNITGGFLWAYDGYGVVEQNFHLFPEDIGYSAMATSSGSIVANSYHYIPIYTWTDNQGNIHRSGTGPAFTVATSSATTGITVNVPTLRLTAKQNTISKVNIELFRDAPSVANGVFYRASSGVVVNNSAVDSLTITDTNTDAKLIGNELLYTTGGVVPNSGGPAAIASTVYKGRLILIDAEDRKKIWFSKPTFTNVPVELSEDFTMYMDPRFGDGSAVAVMDDKLIEFKANAIFYRTGEGPDSTGASNDFGESIFITSVVGCTNFRSIILAPNGLMFQSNKGIWQLGRDLSVTYIGADVEAFNAYSVTSAVLIPNTTQIRFTLSNGLALVYDYYVNQWGTFTNHQAVGATLFQNLFTYLTSTGTILQESTGSYLDNGVPFFMKLSTSWLNLAGLQGYQRAQRLYLKGQFISAHKLNVSLAYDYNPNFTQNATILPRNLINPNYGNDPTYGSTSVYGGVDLGEQYRVNFDRQKCQAIQITIQESIDTSNIVYGPSLKIEAINMVVKRKSGYPRLGAGNIVK